MQKLPRELKNTPGDAPQVPCSVSFGLNRDDYHNKGDHCGSQCSGHSTSLDNSSDVDQPAGICRGLTAEE